MFLRQNVLETPRYVGRWDGGGSRRSTCQPGLVRAPEEHDHGTVQPQSVGRTVGRSVSVIHFRLGDVFTVILSC